MSSLASSTYTSLSCSDMAAQNPRQDFRNASSIREFVSAPLELLGELLEAPVEVVHGDALGVVLHLDGHLEGVDSSPSLGPSWPS